MVRILITGSSDGLGLEAARQLIQRNHTVYLHARNQQRAEEARAKCPGAAGVLIADLTTMAETKKLAEEANAIGTFDAVILNAGMFHGDYRKTPDFGMPALAFVNVIALYSLVCLLNRPKRLILISSTLHKQAKTDLKDPFWLERGEKGFQVFQAYCDSKFHVLLLAKAAARRFKGTSVTAVHPGWIQTKMGGESATDNMQDGIDTYLMLAEGDYDQSLTGVYFEPKRKLAGSLPAGDDENLQEQMVQACEELTKLKLEA
ncbi:Short-chain dehydrogenase/reductase (SDR) family protein [Penicillium ucsense]|uniref:Short-chain dehydrogenase/reductase (SDR) family protein n=1 Tax=Penicillium ucsense TaxID=2839758 RepID=A0A8J8W9F6_9EURO|nr:Short-chain dehydrogenase/reductase (SDR) family protein [Penicillium ucsense]KAF7738580.1 Short-chain dehydrogenase/reductase (SDR) family protein [Penicillium ucsense]